VHSRWLRSGKGDAGDDGRELVHASDGSMGLGPRKGRRLQLDEDASLMFSGAHPDVMQLVLMHSDGLLWP